MPAVYSTLTKVLNSFLKTIEYLFKYSICQKECTTSTTFYTKEDFPFNFLENIRKTASWNRNGQVTTIKYDKTAKESSTLKTI